MLANKLEEFIVAFWILLIPHQGIEVSKEAGHIQDMLLVCPWREQFGSPISKSPRFSSKSDSSDARTPFHWQLKICDSSSAGVQAA